MSHNHEDVAFSAWYNRVKIIIGWSAALEVTFIFLAYFAIRNSILRYIFMTLFYGDVTVDCLFVLNLLEYLFVLILAIFVIFQVLNRCTIF